jgi:ADP-ribose pyrophosphatase YjhB (NUDIX family)
LESFTEIIETISVDCVIFGFKESKLHILLVKQGVGDFKGNWALPGNWVRYNESIDEAAYRILSSQTSVENIFLEQFKVFGEVDRFPKKRVITIGYYALVNIENFELKAGISVSEVKWFEINEVPKMVFDHNHIFENCLEYLKFKIKHKPIGFNLLPERFTLLQLLELYEAILNINLDKPNFRKKFLKMNLLIKTKEREKDVSHRAATLYRFDEKIYNSLVKNGAHFEINI